MAGNSLGDLFVRIKGDTTDFDKSVDKTKKGVDRFATGTGNIAKSLKGLIAGVGLAALAIKVAEIGKASILAASDAEETQNKFNVVFSGMAADANAMATELAGAYGLSQQGAKDMLAGTGDLLTGLDFTQEAALGLSTKVLTLGADLASFTNFSGGAEGASEALTKALLGERESLKALGISINEADLKAEVLRQTEAGLTFETEKQAKANATLTLVTNQSKNAINDFERSQDSFANQMKIAKARTNDLSVEIGRALLPTATEGIGVFSRLTGKLADYIKGLNDVKAAEDAQASGLATREQELLLLNEKIETQEKLKTKLEAQAKFDEEEFGKVLERTKIDKANVEDKLSFLNQVKQGIEAEVRAEESLATSNKVKAEQTAEQELQEEQLAKIREQNNANLLKEIGDINTANKTDIEIIDEKIIQLQEFTAADQESKDAQTAAIQALRDEKLVILEENTEAEKQALLTQLEDRKAFEEETQAIRDQTALDIEEKRLAEIEGRRESAQFIQDTATNIAALVSNFNTEEINGIEEAKNKQISALDEQLLGTDEYNKQKLAIEKTAANKIYEIELAQFNTKKALALSQIAIDTAIGVAKVYGQTGLFGLAAQIPVIAMGIAQAAVVASEPAPARPQLATGAIIPGSARGTNVTVAEGGNDELILGGGSQGEAILNRFADKVNSRNGGGGQTIININSLYPPSKQDLDRLAKDLYTGTIKEQQRRGIN